VPEPEPDHELEGAFEDYPLTRSEYISAMVHFYRGERSRADAWRSRLDPTTNWAVVTTGGMLSFAFSNPENSHVTLLLANLLVTVFLGIEARRFRYFDVWRARVRMLEENFYIPIIRRNLVSPRQDWRERVADDLDRPTFKLTFLQAIAIRLRYNYIWIFLVILLTWLAKIHLHPTPATTPGEAFERLQIGPFSGWAMLALVVTFYGIAVGLAIWGGRLPHHGAIHEVRGLERQLDHWKR
jgi:uncharacterized membrane protein